MHQGQEKIVTSTLNISEWRINNRIRMSWFPPFPLEEISRILQFPSHGRHPHLTFSFKLISIQEIPFLEFPFSISEDYYINWKQMAISKDTVCIWTKCFLEASYIIQPDLSAASNPTRRQPPRLEYGTSCLFQLSYSRCPSSAHCPVVLVFSAGMPLPSSRTALSKCVVCLDKQHPWSLAVKCR